MKISVNKGLSSLLANTLCLIISAASVFGQNTMELGVDFSQRSRSEAYTIKPHQTEFTGLSAYILAPDLDVELSYRTQSEKKWSEWQPFHQNQHGETPDRTAFEAEPIFRHFSKIQFKASNPIKKTVTFRLFFPSDSETDFELKSEPEGSSCNCSQPSYCDRWCWCPDSSCTTGYTPTPTQPTHVIVHHSAGFNSSSDYKSVVAYYWDLHVNTNGWDDIGYNWLIDPNGMIYEGRGSSVVGAHFSCMNSETTGICMIGNFQNTNPTVLAKNALKEFAAWESCDKGIVVTDSSVHSSSQLLLSHISGHRDANPADTGCPSGTVCPGNFLYPQLPAIALDIAASPCLQAVGLNEKTVQNISVYPNPVGDVLNLESTTSSIESLVITDLNGKVLFSKSNPQTQLEVGHFSTGIYLLQLTTADGRHLVKRLVKD